MKFYRETPTVSIKEETSSKKSLIPLILLLLISIGSIPSDTYGLDISVIVFMSVVAFAGIFSHFIANLERNWLRIDTVFVIGFFVVHFQWPLMYVLTDLVPLHRFQSESIEQAGGYGVTLATIALLSWMTGYALAPTVAGSQRVDVIARPTYLALAFALSIFGFSYFAGSSFFERTIYTTVTEDLTQTVTGVAAYFFSIVETLAIVSLAFLFYTHSIAPEKRNLGRVRSKPYASAVLIALLLSYCIIFLVGGDRGQVALLFLGAGVAIAARLRPVRFWELFVLGVSGFVLFTLVGAWRTGVPASELSLVSEFGYWGISTNLAQSVVTLTQAIAIVERDGFYFGALWLSQILGLVPFAQATFLSYSGFSAAEISSALLITQFTFGGNSTTGLGTSFVSDIYLNFGIPGLVAVPALYGGISARMAHWIRGDHGFLRYVAAVAFASLILYVSRGSVLFQLKPIIWSVGFSLLFLRVRRKI